MGRMSHRAKSVCLITDVSNEPLVVIMGTNTQSARSYRPGWARARKLSTVVQLAVIRGDMTIHPTVDAIGWNAYRPYHERTDT